MSPMPVIERDLDGKSRVVVPKDFTEKWGDKILIHPNYCAIVLRPKNVKLREAIKSVQILFEDMCHQLELTEGIELPRCGECGRYVIHSMGHNKKKEGEEKDEQAESDKSE